MEPSEINKHLSEDFQIKVAEPEKWTLPDLEDLLAPVTLLSLTFGGLSQFRHTLGEVLVERTDTGKHLGLAYAGRIQLSASTPFSSWSVVHELAHAWDAKNQWRLSRQLVGFTGGYTNPLFSFLKKKFQYEWDAGVNGSENKAGYYGRKPGVNAAGYFYGDIPSGSNWNFNRKEDFAESVVMYCGWGRDNSLSRSAHGRIERYLLPNGTKDPIYGITENWSDYARYFYPANGDYKKTKRWKFIDGLMHNNM
ncbi:MAG: hypothetical protein HZB50_10095 [Chloroflexi bacterium]|nr:hypothetical protein [Chloroflexota bacterium]